MAFFWQALNTLKVPMSLHAKNRARLLERFGDVEPNGVILLQGVKSKTRHDTDRDLLHRQESFFHWVFGAYEGDLYGAIDISRKKSILFIPRLSIDYAVWLGSIPTPEDIVKKYEVDEVRFVDELDTVLGQEIKASVVYVINGINSDSKKPAKEARFPGLDKYKIDRTKLYREMTALRVYKTPEEIQVLRYVASISSDAHKYVMKRCRPGMTEYQLEALFLEYVYFHGGCREVAYTCICCTGSHGAILHYGHSGAPNNGVIQDGDMMLLDMGAEYHCYCSDITCSFPCNGKFTQDQKDIFESVAAAQSAVLNAMRPGVCWPDMHLLAERTLLTELVSRGIMKGSVDAMMQKRIAALLQPHGLGHLLGLDTHDVGGYPEGVNRIDSPGLRKLRTGRILEAGMYITVEPGCYFIPALLEPALQDPEVAAFFVPERIQRLMTFGGVRLEDDVLVTADGVENFTKCPRTVEGIEALMAQGRSEFPDASAI